MCETIEDFLCCKQNTGLRSFFFAETKLTSMCHMYLNMLEHFLVPLLGVTRWAHPQYHRNVTWNLNRTFLGRWIGHGGYIPWPSRSPHLTPMGFSIWGFVKESVHIPPMPVDPQELPDRIVRAVVLVGGTFLNKLWDELEYRLDVCRITKGSHIEHL
jgi:hypothetical protein